MHLLESIAKNMPMMMLNLAIFFFLWVASLIIGAAVYHVYPAWFEICLVILLGLCAMDLERQIRIGFIPGAIVTFICSPITGIFYVAGASINNLPGSRGGPACLIICGYLVMMVINVIRKG